MSSPNSELGMVMNEDSARFLYDQQRVEQPLCPFVDVKLQALD